MEGFESKIVKVHFYRKMPESLKGNDIGIVKVYIDGEAVCMMSPGDVKEAEIAPGTHTIELGLPNMLGTRKTEYIDIKNDTTDVYIAFGRTVYTDTRSKPMSFEAVEQFNRDCMYSNVNKNVKLVVQRTYSVYDKGDWLKVTIDGIEAIKADQNSDVEIFVTPGKHMIFYETKNLIKYASIDIPQNCTSYYVSMGVFNVSSYSNIRELKIINERPMYENGFDDINKKEVECVITRGTSISTAALLSFEVTIDDNIKFNLKNGEKKVIKISTGDHSIVVRKGQMMYSKKISIPDSCRKVYIDTKYKFFEKDGLTVRIV